MNKTIRNVLWILGIFLLVSIIYWLTSDSIAQLGLTANPLIVIGLDIISNPFYIGTFILAIEGAFRLFRLTRNFINYLRVAFASLIFSLAIDILSPIHSFFINYTLPSNYSSVSIYFDTIIGRMLMPLLYPLGMVGTFILYVLIPLLMVIISLIIASPRHFIELAKGQVGRKY